MFSIQDNHNTLACRTNSCVSADDASLKTNNIRGVDTGLYRCEVAATAGNLTALMYIRVFGKSSHVHSLPAIIFVTCNFYIFEHSYYIIYWDRNTLSDEHKY